MEKKLVRTEFRGVSTHLISDAFLAVCCLAPFPSLPEEPAALHGSSRNKRAISRDKERVFLFLGGGGGERLSKARGGIEPNTHRSDLDISISSVLGVLHATSGRYLHKQNHFALYLAAKKNMVRKILAPHATRSTRNQEQMMMMMCPTATLSAVQSTNSPFLKKYKKKSQPAPRRRD